MAGCKEWSLVGGSWVLDYTLSTGLNYELANTNTDGTSGLYGLTGEVIGGQVELFATNYTLGDLDQTYLYGITDTLSATTNPGEAFTQLAAAPVDSNFKGVSRSLAPVVPEPSIHSCFWDWASGACAWAAWANSASAAGKPRQASLVSTPSRNVLISAK